MFLPLRMPTMAVQVLPLPVLMPTMVLQVLLLPIPTMVVQVLAGAVATTLAYLPWQSRVQVGVVV